MNSQAMEKMFNKVRVNVSNLSILVGLAVLLGSIGFFTLGRSRFLSPQLKIEEEYTFNPSVWEDDVSSFYIRKFRCIKVEEVKLNSFAVKAGKVTPIWNGYYQRTSGITPPSSSCLFMLLSGSQFKSPWMEFSFSGGSTSSGEGRPLSLKPGDTVSQEKVSSNLAASDNASAGWQPQSLLQTLPEKTSLSRGKPVLLYVKVFGSSTLEKASLELPMLSSIEEVQDFSSKHKDLEFLAIKMLWSN